MPLIADIIISLRWCFRWLIFSAAAAFSLLMLPFSFFFLSITASFHWLRHFRFRLFPDYVIWLLMITFRHFSAAAADWYASLPHCLLRCRHFRCFFRFSIGFLFISISSPFSFRYADFSLDFHFRFLLRHCWLSISLIITLLFHWFFAFSSPLPLRPSMPVFFATPLIFRCFHAIFRYTPYAITLMPCFAFRASFTPVISPSPLLLRFLSLLISPFTDTDWFLWLSPFILFAAIEIHILLFTLLIDIAWYCFLSFRCWLFSSRCHWLYFLRYAIITPLIIALISIFAITLHYFFLIFAIDYFHYHFFLCHFRHFTLFHAFFFSSHCHSFIFAAFRLSCYFDVDIIFSLFCRWWLRHWLFLRWCWYFLFAFRYLHYWCYYCCLLIFPFSSLYYYVYWYFDTLIFDYVSFSFWLLFFAISIIAFHSFMIISFSDYFFFFIIFAFFDAIAYWCFHYYHWFWCHWLLFFIYVILHRLIIFADGFLFFRHYADFLCRRHFFHTTSFFFRFLFDFAISFSFHAWLLFFSLIDIDYDISLFIRPLIIFSIILLLLIFRLILLIFDYFSLFRHWYYITFISITFSSLIIYFVWYTILFLSFHYLMMLFFSLFHAAVCHYFHFSSPFWCWFWYFSLLFADYFSLLDIAFRY